MPCVLKEKLKDETLVMDAHPMLRKTRIPNIPNQSYRRLPDPFQPQKNPPIIILLVVICDRYNCPRMSDKTFPDHIKPDHALIVLCAKEKVLTQAQLDQYTKTAESMRRYSHNLTLTRVTLVGDFNRPRFHHTNIFNDIWFFVIRAHGNTMDKISYWEDDEFLTIDNFNKDSLDNLMDFSHESFFKWDSEKPFLALRSWVSQHRDQYKQSEGYIPYRLTKNIIQ